MITVLSDDKKQSVGKRVYEMMKEKGFETEYISVTGLNIKPCYSCNSCNTKTYGKCVIKDDMDPILRKLIRTEKIVLATPVMWGSYSSDVKRIVDRTSVIGDCHYFVKKGELTKGVRSNVKQMFAIGVKENRSIEEKEEFVSLLHENVTIMNIKGKAFVVNEESDIESMVEEICR